MAKASDALPAEILDDSLQYGLEEVCEVCGVQADYVVEMVEAGIIEAQGDRPATWRFSALSVVRSRKALRLQRDLDINLPGLALALDLLDEVESLRDQIDALRHQLDKLQR